MKGGKHIRDMANEMVTMGIVQWLHKAICSRNVEGNKESRVGEGLLSVRNMTPHDDDDDFLCALPKTGRKFQEKKKHSKQHNQRHTILICNGDYGGITKRECAAQ